MARRLPIVLACVSHQADEVNRLVDFCRRLDDSRVEVVEITKVQDALWRSDHDRHPNGFAQLQARTFNYAATQFKAAPFIWLEPDSVPLVAGWADKLERAYRDSGKQFLLTTDSDPPRDLACGIGIYPVHACSLVPYRLEQHGWDLHVTTRYRDLTLFSPLVQHSYGLYGADGYAIPRRFTTEAERAFLRLDAVIFHRDLYQDLIPSPQAS